MDIQQPFNDTFFSFLLAMHFMCMAYTLVLGYQSDFFLVVRLFILVGLASVIISVEI